MITMIFDILHLWIRIISDGQRGHSALEAAVRMLVAKQGSVFVTLMNVSCHFFNYPDISLFSITLLLQHTCKPMVSVIGIKQPPSSVTMRNTENPSHLRGQIGASARIRTATRRSVTTLETTRHASFPPTPTSLITTVSFAGRC